MRITPEDLSISKPGVVGPTPDEHHLGQIWVVKQNFGDFIRHTYFICVRIKFQTKVCKPNAYSWIPLNGDPDYMGTGTEDDALGRFCLPRSKPNIEIKHVALKAQVIREYDG